MCPQTWILLNACESPRHARPDRAMLNILCVLMFRSAPLRLMFGLVAVGMDCGHVYLVDLRLDDDVEEFDEWNQSHLEIVDPDDPNFASLRSRAREDGAHIAFELGGLSFLHHFVFLY